MNHFRNLGGTPVLAVALSAVLAACGGSSPAKKADGRADATSRRNAYSASSSGAANTVRSEGNSSNSALSRRNQAWTKAYLAGASTMEESDEGSDLPAVGTTKSAKGKCEKEGSFSGVAKVTESSQEKMAATFDIKFKDCASSDNGKLGTGHLKLDVVITEQEISMVFNGETDSEGKNAKGEMVPHNIVFDNVLVSFSTNASLLSSSSIGCTSGSVIVDGVKKSCQEFEKEYAEQTQSQASPVSEESKEEVPSDDESDDELEDEETSEEFNAFPQE